MTPWVHLARPGNILYCVSEKTGTESIGEICEKTKKEDEATSKSDPDIPPQGIALSKDDLTELLAAAARNAREHHQRATASQGNQWRFG